MSVDQENDFTLEKTRVANSFGRASGLYHSASQLQEGVANELFERLDLMTLVPARILDLGSGPGKAATKLVKRFRKARLIELDISFDMLAEAKRDTPRFFSRRSKLCNDAENLSLATSSVDLVFSNLMLQWCQDLDAAFKEIARVLKPGGLFIFSSFGPDTLVELRQSWAAVDDSVHVNAFIDMHDVGDALMRAQLENPVLETDLLLRSYESAWPLMRELKTLGAHNVNSGRRRTLTGKTKFNGMLAEYEKLRQAEGLPASYEVVYGHAWAPAAQLARRVDEMTSTYPLSALRGSNQT